MQALSPEFRRELQDRIETMITPLQGWGTVEKGMRLAELVLASEAEISVEIGVFGGRGLLPLALAHQILGTGYAVGIDPWEVTASLEGENTPENDEWWRSIDHDAIYVGFIEALVGASLVRESRIMRESAETAVRLFPDESISVLHQDGNHSERVSTREVELWTPKLKPGGYWVFDDTDWASTRRAQERLAELGFHVLESHPGWKIFHRP